MWSSAIDGRVLTFRLVGINNQNFVMQDDQTGSWWQQVSGEAILGPLKGRRLTLLPFDHLTFALWREESPRGRVLAPVDAVAAANRYARADWEQRMTKTPAPLAADRQLEPRTLVIGVEVRGASRAYPLAGISAVGVVLDEIGGTAIAIVRAPDGRSTRVFDRTVDGRPLELHRESRRVAVPPGRCRHRQRVDVCRRRRQRSPRRPAARTPAISGGVLVRLEDVSPIHRRGASQLLT